MDEPCIVVCVTGQKTCAQLIDKGQQLAQQQHLELHVIHVAAPGADILDNCDQAQAIEFLYAIAKQAGAQMTVQRDRDAVGAIVRFVLKQQGKVLVLGKDKSGKNYFESQLQSRLPKVTFCSMETYEDA